MIGDVLIAVMQLIVLGACAVLAVFNRRTNRNIREVGRLQVEHRKQHQLMNELWDQHTAHHEVLNGLRADVAELQSLRAELRRHTTSNLLHPERADVP